MPAGSVRAILALIIMATVWLILLLPEKFDVRLPLAMYALLSMVLFFFTSHGHTIAPTGSSQPSPLHLPRGFFRILLLAGTGAVVGWQYYNNPDLLLKRLTPAPEQLPNWPNVLLALSGGFALGWLFRFGPWRRAAWFQDILAWFSMIAMLGLLVEVVILVFINPGLSSQVNLEYLEWGITAIVAYYFGARS
jgi:hypothetical protein